MLVWLLVAAIWAAPGFITGAFDPKNPATLALIEKCKKAEKDYKKGAIEVLPLSCTVEPYIN